VKTLHRILAAVDVSEPARAAFDRALALSRSHDAELMVVHAVPSERPFNWDARERLALIGALSRAAKEAGVRFKISVQHGDPAGVILLHARSRGADLIVMGTNRRSGFDRYRFGSVAETVTLQATQPVLVVPAADRDADDSAAPLSNILVAVDLGESSRAAIERALSIADDSRQVTVIHVVPGMARAGASRYMYHLMEPEYQRQLARDARRKIAELIPASAKTSRKVHVRVATGDPAAEISRVAAETEAGMILVGVTPRGAIGRRIFGSTAARVMRTAGVPVLAVAA
jgi:nucleotide-binding universal stress UspA family protein